MVGIISYRMLIHTNMFGSHYIFVFTPKQFVTKNKICFTSKSNFDCFFDDSHLKCVSHHAHVITPKEYCSHHKMYSSHPNSEDSYH
jgi:hypothetical protein